MPHIRLTHFLEEQRRPRRGGGDAAPLRDQAEHGEHLRQQLAEAVSAHASQLATRDLGLPPVPDGFQLVVKSALSDSGRPLLTADQIPARWHVDILDERRDGLILTASPDPEVSRLSETVEAYKNDERTQAGRLKPGTRGLFSVDDLPVPAREFKMGPTLLRLLEETPLAPDNTYVVDIEIAAHSFDQTTGERAAAFADYLRSGHAELISGPVTQIDYIVFRAFVRGALLSDMLDFHPWTAFVDSPPELEQQGMALRSITEPGIPPIEAPDGTAPVIVVIDGAVAVGHPLIAPSCHGQHHTSIVPNEPFVDAQNARGHGTAVASVAALGSLRTCLLPNNAPIRPARVAVLRVLDDDDRLPDALDLFSLLPQACHDIATANDASVFSCSLASLDPFARDRMTRDAEALDLIAYDEGGPGLLFILPTGNLDGRNVPSFTQIDGRLRGVGHPDHLLFEDSRLRRPGHAISALTVGAYVPQASTSRDDFARLLNPIAGSAEASPLTRTGLGYLGEIKPELVEEGGNWYSAPTGEIVVEAQVTDVPVANSAYAQDGRLIRFSQGSSVAVPKVAHLVSDILRVLPDASADLLRAAVVNSAEWPEQLATQERTLRTYGYGVPSPERALNPGGSRCILIIEDAVPIGWAHYHTIPFPTDLFEMIPETILRVSVTLAYRPPVRRGNRIYRGTVLEWDMAQRGQSLDSFRTRCSTFRGEDQADIGQDEADEQTGPWSWTIRKRLRTKGTAQKDWFDAPATAFDDHLFLSVIGRRGWLSREQQTDGFLQRYAVVISIEAHGVAIPLHERIEAQIRVPVRLN
jgi:hypothetical protein